MSYKQLEIWQLAREIVIEVYKMTLTLPVFEMYEEGRQIRKSSKSTKAMIAEGFGRKRYKNEFIKFLVYALGSNDETMDHLENLFETGSLTNIESYTQNKQKIELLGKKLTNFIRSVEKQHVSAK